MQIEKLTQAYLDSILDKEKIPVVSGSLELQRTGKSPTPRTPFYKDKSETEVISNWLKLLSESGYDSKFPRLLEYEKSRVEKVGPQGGYPPLADRMPDLEAYFKNWRALELDPDEQRELENSVRVFLFGEVRDRRPMSYESVLQRDTAEDKLNTNSGCPAFGKRSDSIIQQRAVRDAYSGKWKSQPAILGSRSQRGKARFIFMFPFAANLVEKSFLIPLMEIIRSREIPSFSAWEGFEEVEDTLFKTSFFNSDTLISMDYTKMDTYCGPPFMTFVYNVISPVFQEKYRPLLYESLAYANNIPILIGIDKMATGPHGLASGSGWTNFTESVFSQAVRFEVIFDLYTRGDNMIEMADQGLGDDGALSLKDSRAPFNIIAEVIQESSKRMGLEANADKQRIDENTIVYLQRFFDRDIFINGTDVVAGCYPSILALNTAMNPERFHDPRKWDSSKEILRWIMILENCNHTPYFTDLIEYFIKGDKFKLGLNIPGFFKRDIVKVYEDSKSINGFVPSYNQANFERGILEFDTVKYLMSRVS